MPPRASFLSGLATMCLSMAIPVWARPTLTLCLKGLSPKTAMGVVKVVNRLAIPRCLHQPLGAQLVHVLAMLLACPAGYWVSSIVPGLRFSGPCIWVSQACLLVTLKECIPFLKACCLNQSHPVA